MFICRVYMTDRTGVYEASLTICKKRGEEMTNIVCYASDGSVLEYYYQWSVDQSLIIKGADTSLAPIFYFSNVKFNTAFIVNPEIRGDSLVVTVPNILLQYPFPIIIDADYSVNSKSDFSLRIPVMPKARPGDYVYSDNSGSGGTGGSGSTIQIADNLTTNSSVVALAASQGVVLKAMIDNISDDVDGDTSVIVQGNEPEDKTVLWIDTSDKGDSLQDVVNIALAQAKESGEFNGADYVLTESDKAEIADIVAELFGSPEIGDIDLAGYATKEWARDEFQPKGNYLVEVPDEYAKTSDIPTKPEDIGAQPSGNYLTEVPIGYATEEFVKNRIAEAELSGGDVDLSGFAQKSEIPTKVSQLQNDKGYLTEHQSLAGYAKKTDIPSVPTKVSQLENDAGYLTKHQSLTNYATKQFVQDGYQPKGDYLTEDDKNDVVLKLSAENLLDNSDFRNPFNQRGNSCYVADGTRRHTIDRWTAPGNLQVDILESCVRLTCKSTTNANGLTQTLVKSPKSGTKVTVALMEKDGTLHFGTKEFPASSYTTPFEIGPSDDPDASVRLYGDGKISIMVNIGKTIDVAWVALYEGVYTTETLPEYRSKGYTEELLACQTELLVLSSLRYGTEFPSDAPDGTIFFKKVT